MPENELVEVIARYLDDNDLIVTRPDGTVIRYGVLDDAVSEAVREPGQ